MKGLIPTAVLFLMVGCGGETLPQAPEFSAVDSGGVSLVENRWQGFEVPTWEPHEEPLLRIGSEREGSAELFGRVTEARVGPDGKLWIVDGMVLNVRVFESPGGEFRFSSGGRGQGPGEFQGIQFLGFDEEGAWFWDRILGRVTSFTPRGELGTVRRVGQELEILPRVAARTGRGSFVATLPRAVAGPVSEGMVLRDTTRLWELGTDVGEAELMVEQPGPLWYLSDRGQIPVPFTDGGRFAARGNRVVVSDPDGMPVLHVLDDGRPSMQVRTDLDRQPVLPADVRRAVERLGFQGEAPRGMPVPSVSPVWGYLQIGSDGSLLALRYPRGPHPSPEEAHVWEWDVFTPDGRHAGRLVFPAGSSLLDYGPKHIVVLKTPDFEGHRVYVYSSPRWE